MTVIVDGSEDLMMFDFHCLHSYNLNAKRTGERKLKCKCACAV